MKKLLVMCVSLLVATAGLFAAGGKEREMTFFGGYQGNFYNYKMTLIDPSSSAYLKLDMQESYQGMSLGFEMREMYGDMIGSNISLAFNLPFSATFTMKNIGSKKTYQRRDFDSLFGIEMFGGLLIRPIRTNKMSLNLTPGIHMSILSPKLTSDIASYISVGLGGDVSVDFALTQKIFMTAGVTASFDFLPISDALEGAKIFAVTPKLGVGFQI